MVVLEPVELLVLLLVLLVLLELLLPVFSLVMASTDKATFVKSLAAERSVVVEAVINFPLVKVIFS